MTHFLLGFLSAVALIAVTVIVWAVVAHRRKEHQARPSLQDIMAKASLCTDEELCMHLSDIRLRAASGKLTAHDERMEAAILNVMYERSAPLKPAGQFFKTPPNPQGKKGVH